MTYMPYILFISFLTIKENTFKKGYKIINWKKHFLKILMNEEH